MNLSLWLRFAARDLRSGLQGFWIFLTCLALGTGTIAIIGSLTAAIEPMLIVFLGITVGGVVIAMYMPMFTMIQALK